MRNGGGRHQELSTLMEVTLPKWPLTATFGGLRGSACRTARMGASSGRLRWSKAADLHQSTQLFVPVHRVATLCA